MRLGLRLRLELRLRLDQCYISKFFTFAVGWVGGGGVEIWRLKLTSAKVEVEVEAELGKTVT